MYVSPCICDVLCCAVLGYLQVAICETVPDVAIRGGNMRQRDRDRDREAVGGARE